MYIYIHIYDLYLYFFLSTFTGPSLNKAKVFAANQRYAGTERERLLNY